ncbi:MAG: asparaginyl-tRNA synthetase [Pseudomonadota bacterium]|nr:asparaginyl-tRNA synthetase [Pseudomonadota bacterium]
MSSYSIYSVKQILSRQVLSSTPELDTQVELRGWVRSRRDSKSGISFIALSDGSCFDTIQIVAQNNLANYADILRLTKDCSIIVTGKVVASLGEGQHIEILADNIKILGFVENPDSYPVSPKRHTVEYLREVAHLRPRTNLIAAVMRIRNTVSYAIHQYLQDNGFFWIHTPLITAADAEGAGELFQVTSLDLNNLPKDEQGKVDFKRDFFGSPTFLTVSGQLNAEAYCLGMSKVYTFGPTFRAENSNTTRHLAEFWMVEPEIAFANLMDNALLAKSLLKYVFKTVLDKNADDMGFFAQFINKDVVTRLEQLVNQEFAVLTYTEAIDFLLKSNKSFENEVSWGIDLASEHERWLCEELMQRPTVVTDYPRDIKAFYMRQNDDGKTVAAMDILAPGVGEIIGGAQREERYDVLVARMQEMDISRETLYWYLDLRRFGTVPHAGFGLGLERLISYITGVQNVRDVIPFPRASKSANF